MSVRSTYKYLRVRVMTAEDRSGRRVGEVGPLAHFSLQRGYVSLGMTEDRTMAVDDAVSRQADISDRHIP